jgi:CheY-like chemotaxis protein
MVGMPAGPENPGFDLGLVSILVVEDGAFIRSVLVGVLRTLGVGQIFTVADGSEAIAFLEKRKAALPPGTAPVDLVLTDLILKEIDGLTLLRWIRHSPNSPDRFLPVLMLSGAADRTYVEQARDLGITEFLAKPFTARTIGSRLLHALARPRRFVLCNGYFGPDRRRVEKPVQIECRAMRNEDILVVHSNTRVAAMDRHPVVYFELPNRLGMKVGLSAAKGAPPVFSEDVLAAAEAAIESRTGDYSTWIGAEVDTMIRNTERLSGDPAQIRALIGEIHHAAHEMRGQGGIFGYPLVTMIAKSLYEATRGPAGAVSQPEQELFRAHADAIKAVMSGRIRGDGGPVGRQLLAGLDAAKRKYGKTPES